MTDTTKRGAVLERFANYADNGSIEYDIDAMAHRIAELETAYTKLQRIFANLQKQANHSRYSHSERDAIREAIATAEWLVEYSPIEESAS